MAYLGTHHTPGTGMSFADKYPAEAAMWHPTLNDGARPEDFKPFSYKTAWFVDSSGHEWESALITRSTIASRGRGGMCPRCSRRHKGILAVKYPNLAAEWHPTKNGELTPRDVLFSDHTRIWWICGRGHEWQTEIRIRAQGFGCRTCCSIRQTVPRPGRSFAERVPHAAAQWHPERNGDKTPDQFGAATCHVAWFIDEHGCEWKRQLRHCSNIESYCPNRSVAPGQASYEESFIINLIGVIIDEPVLLGPSIGVPGEPRLIPDGFLERRGICIDYDSAYWHRYGQELDQRKTRRVLDRGYRMIRIRQYPLGEIPEAENVRFGDSAHEVWMASATAAHIMEADVRRVWDTVTLQQIALAHDQAAARFEESA